MNIAFIEIYFKIIAFIFGSMIGSFLNVVIHRVPLKQNIALPRSSCPKCGKLIHWYENIPIFSYLFLKGKCSNCNSKISFRYPLIEVITGIASLLLLPEYFSAYSIWKYFYFLSIFAVFLSLFMIDLEHYLLPDPLNLYLGAILFCNSVLYYGWSHWVIGGLIGFLFPLGITWIFYKLKGKVGLGGGDIKLYTALGIGLGPKLIVQNIFLSSFIGSLFGIFGILILKMDKNKPLPFGPFILIVAFAQIFFPDQYAQIMQFIIG